MEKDYVVLRSKARPRSRGGGPVAGPAGEPEGLEAIEVSEVSLTEAERGSLERDPQTRAVAAAMPLSLIEPVGADDAGPADAGDVTWGVEAVGATESPFDGSSVSVAVLDTGIKPDVPSFAGMDIVQKNFTTAGDDDSHGHGTHCAGTIFGQDTDGTRIGVARGIDRALIGKVLGPGGGSSATLVQAIQWAVNEGAHIISMSLGIDFPGYVDWLVNQHGMNIRAATSQALAEYRQNVNLFGAVGDLLRAEVGFTQGTMIIAASGNESERPGYTIAVAPPAAGVGIMAIGALANTPGGYSIARFSNTEVDVTAPGVDVRSAGLNGGLVSMSGTSMATPHVAGVAALWAQRLIDTTGSFNPGRVVSHLVAGADTASLAAGFDIDDVGAGIVQAPKS